jgi:catechol 2,3-dioxygenase-like lactoylglutathione lyase family enzyme
MSSAKVHVHMVVSDLDQSEAFYSAFFGAEPVKQMPGYSKFLPTWGPVNLALSEGAEPRGAGVVQYMGIQLDSPGEVSEHLARVKAAGLPVDEEIGVTCCYANSDKFWVTDPDGFRWEVYFLNFDVDTPGKFFPKGSMTLLPLQECCS